MKPILAASLMVVTLLTGCSKLMGCPNRLVQEVDSPAGRFVGTVRECGCTAVSSTYYLAFIVTKGADNSCTAAGRDPAALVSLHGGGPHSSLEWEDEYTLLVLRSGVSEHNQAVHAKSSEHRRDVEPHAPIIAFSPSVPVKDSVSVIVDPSVEIVSKDLYPPRYPPSAANAGIQGTVMLVVFVGANGNVTNVSVERSSRNRELDRAAMDAARMWRYNAGTVDGQPAAGWVRVPVEFTM